MRSTTSFWCFLENFPRPTCTRHSLPAPVHHPHRHIDLRKIPSPEFIEKLLAADLPALAHRAGTHAVARSSVSDRLKRLVEDALAVFDLRRATRSKPLGSISRTLRFKMRPLHEVVCGPLAPGPPVKALRRVVCFAALRGHFLLERGPRQQNRFRWSWRYRFHGNCNAPASRRLITCGRVRGRNPECGDFPPPSAPS